MKKILAGILILFLIFLFACTNKNNTVSPWISPLILPVTDWYEATGNASFSPRYGQTSVVYDDKMWVIGGWNGGVKNDVWYSTNGKNWLGATGGATFAARYGHSSVVYDNKMWVIAGLTNPNNIPTYVNDVWYSADGVNWTQATGNSGFTGRYMQTSVVYNNKMWVIGGSQGNNFMNNVLYSADGKTWTQATGNAAFAGRSGHTSVVYDNKMWVIGGYNIPNYANYFSDVWYSADGATWIEATGNAAFGARVDHTSVIYDNKMWVMGGYVGGVGVMKDMWYSTDGVDWTEATGNAGFGLRDYFTSVVYDNKMWVIGGAGTSGYINDIWDTP